MPSIAELHDEMNRYRTKDSSYWSKMMHPIPEGDVVDREEFILKYCHGRRVLNLGSASGPLHEGIKAIAEFCIGVDKQKSDNPLDIWRDLDIHPIEIDSSRWLDTFVPVPELKTINLIVAGEILEHLTNPGLMIAGVKSFDCELLITVPNAFTEAGRKHILKGYENVNLDHVAWYSPHTLKTLLNRYKFEITSFHWYNGKSGTAEGIIVTAR